MEKFQTKACCIDQAVARLTLLGHSLRFSHNNQVVKVIKLFIIWLTNRRNANLFKR